jgi:hypothetical protein
MTPLLIVFFTLVVPVALVVATFFFIRRWQERDGRRSPLVDKLFHGPGEQLRKRIEGHDDEINGTLVTVFLIGPLVVASWGLSRADWSQALTWWSLLLPSLLAAAVLGWCIWKIAHHTRARRRAREGLAAELMTAQLLTPLMADGCQVLHDIPAGKFNIDHVVIGPYAVYMIETKSRRKPRTTGKESAQVAYTGEALHFPKGIVESRPVEQARAQAQWLHDYLRSAAGAAVRIVPVVALPGWYVNPGKGARHSDVYVINPKMHTIFFDKNFGQPISNSLRSRVVHALTQRYPDLE